MKTCIGPGHRTSTECWAFEGDSGNDGTVAVSGSGRLPRRIVTLRGILSALLPETSNTLGV